MVPFMDVLHFNRLQLFVFRKSSLLCAFPVLCLPISTGILLLAALPLLPVFLFVHALIMRYGTVVYSVSEGDFGYHPRLE